jgi:hypothetical protein
MLVIGSETVAGPPDAGVQVIAPWSLLKDRMPSFFLKRVWPVRLAIATRPRLPMRTEVSPNQDVELFQSHR